MPSSPWRYGRGGAGHGGPPAPSGEAAAGHLSGRRRHRRVGFPPLAADRPGDSRRPERSERRPLPAAIAGRGDALSAPAGGGAAMKQAAKPFQFMAASTLVRICGVEVRTVADLLEHLRTISAASVFNHTFQSLGQHHFLTEGFSNDFAQWVL